MFTKLPIASHIAGCPKTTLELKQREQGVAAYLHIPGKLLEEVDVGANAHQALTRLAEHKAAQPWRRAIKKLADSQPANDNTH